MRMLPPLLLAATLLAGIEGGPPSLRPNDDDDDDLLLDDDALQPRRLPGLDDRLPEPSSFSVAPPPPPPEIKGRWVPLTALNEPQRKTKERKRRRRRKRRFVLGNKLRTVAIPLSVFNFLGFLPVRVPGLPYHDELPSPDHAFYDTTYEVYVPRRKRLFRFYD